jgi:membrane protein YqaA with SNARE-associated domain
MSAGLIALAILMGTLGGLVGYWVAECGKRAYRRRRDGVA